MVTSFSFVRGPCQVPGTRWRRGPPTLRHPGESRDPFSLDGPTRQSGVVGRAYPAGRAGRLPGRSCATLGRPGSAHDLLLERLGHLYDVLGRPAGDFHAQAETHARQHFLDLVERLAAEVRRAQHLGFGLLDQIADIDDVVVLEAVGAT